MGGILIGMCEQFASAYLPAGFKETSAYLLMLVILILYPNGLFSQIQSKKV